jgi:hypothetical protein
MKTYTTPNGKEIQIVRDPKTAHIKIQFGSGGELPQELSGFYTSESFASRTIVGYLEGLAKQPVEVKQEEKEAPKEEVIAVKQTKSKVAPSKED